VEGAAQGNEAAPAEEGTDFGGDAAQGAAGFVARPAAPAAFVAAEERDPARAAARIAIVGLAAGIVVPGAQRSPPAHFPRAALGGAEGRPLQGPGHPPRGGAQGG